MFYFIEILATEYPSVNATKGHEMQNVKLSNSGMEILSDMNCYSET